DRTEQGVVFFSSENNRNRLSDGIFRQSVQRPGLRFDRQKKFARREDNNFSYRYAHCDFAYKSNFRAYFMKKTLLFLLLISFAAILTCFSFTAAAEEDDKQQGLTEEEVYDELQNNVNDGMDAIDFTELEEW